MLGLAGLQLQRKQPKSSRYTLEGALEHVVGIGFIPQTVIDVGAGFGTPCLYDNFPKAKHILIEPLEENRLYLEKIARELPGSEYLIAAAHAATGNVVLHVHPDLLGSSLYWEEEDSDVNGIPRTVPAVTLDEVCQKRNCLGPYLIKVDTQGSELDVLRGASRILQETEYVVLEVSLFNFFKQGPQIFDVITFMKTMGFVVYEALDYKYRPLDGAMAQMDLVFVRETGIFRKQHSYATRDQRKQHTKKVIGTYQRMAVAIL